MKNSMAQLFSLSQPVNESVRNYSPGSAEKKSLKARLSTMANERIDIPCVIGGKEVRTGRTKKVVMPHSHGEILAEFHLAGPKELAMAVEASQKAKADWESWSWMERAMVFCKAADLLAGPWRDTINAATMLGQSKNCFQAEIDAACEMADFLRFNSYFYQKILQDQPLSVPGVLNSVDYRPLEGFVLAITPFNFTAIAGNLCASPALTGNTAIWKPSDTQALSAYYTYKLFEEAGVPEGVINLVFADGPEFGSTLLTHPDMAGVHFTGSTATFQHIQRTVGENIARYKSYPRLVGETGGKDFVFAHPSADPDILISNLVRGAFEYQGQKCSAASRAYVPMGLWNQIQSKLVEEVSSLKMGDVRDFRNFVNAVIDDRAFQKISGYQKAMKESSDVRIIAGGGSSNQKGYFVEPTVGVTTNPKYKTMCEEIFGPILTIYPYDEKQLAETAKLCASSSEYALTGAVIAQDRGALLNLAQTMRHAAGNLYFNDKPTGAVVGQQPFGGGRASGTNDKAGSLWNLIRWISPRTIKEMTVPVKNYRYPFLGEE